MLFGRMNEAKREDAVRLREYHTIYLGFKISSYRDRIRDFGILPQEGQSLYQFPTKDFHRKLNGLLENFCLN